MVDLELSIFPSTHERKQVFFVYASVSYSAIALLFCRTIFHMEPGNVLEDIAPENDQKMEYVSTLDGQFWTTIKPEFQPNRDAILYYTASILHPKGLFHFEVVHLDPYKFLIRHQDQPVYLVEIIGENSPRIIQEATICNIITRKINIKICKLVNTLFQSPRRVLYFSPKQKARKENNKDIEEDDWPVKGRNKPLITSPVYVCDLPNLDTPLTWTRQGIDWGSSGFIGFIHKRCCVYTYNPDKNRKFRMVIGEEIGHCLKWNKYGDQFTLSLRRGKLGLWDLPKEKMVRRGHSSDITKGDVSCIVQTDSLIITGHRKGMLQIWNYDLFPVAAEHEAHKGAIVNAKVSCDGNYLATSGTDSFVKIWSLPSCKKIFEIHYDYPITSIDWHPWKAPLLAVGRATRNSFCMLWNVNRPTNEYTLDRFEYAKVDCMTFNPISAELVTGFWLDHPTDDSKYSHSIVVQNNLSTIVDDINFHSARAMYLLWDKEGKRLATVGADENLALWDFFGQEKKKQITPIKRDAGIIWNEIIR